MQKRIGLLGTASVAALVGVATWSAPAEGADHTDSPAVSGDPLNDITDFFAWMSDDAANVNLVMTINPFATEVTSFGNASQYVFHIHSRADFGATGEMEARVVCQFYDANAIECWVLDDSGSVVDYVTGDPSPTAGIQSDSGAVRVFAGLRDDPFYFNLDGFARTVDTVRGAAGGLTFDEGGCPTVDAATSAELVRQLTTDADDSPATDDLQDANILALVVQIDKTLVNGGGPILATWASTHRAGE